MHGKKRREEKDQDQNQTRDYLRCQVCGSKMTPDACFWEEDGGGGIYCRDCKAEKESCGCSD